MAQIRNLVGATILITPLLAVLYLLNQWNIAVDKTTDFNDYWGIFLYASSTYGLDFWLGKVSILGKGSFGSATFLQYMPWAFLLVFAIWGANVAYNSLLKKESYWNLWVPLPWLIISTLWMLTAMGVAAFAHYDDLYTQRLVSGAIKGEVDWITHWFSTGIFAIPLLTIDFPAILKWRGRIGRLKELLFVASIMGVIMLTWEIGESGNPAVYQNLYWDSVKDMMVGLAATVFLWLTNYFVSPE